MWTPQQVKVEFKPAVTYSNSAYYSNVDNERIEVKNKRGETMNILGTAIMIGGATIGVAAIIAIIVYREKIFK